MTSLMLDDIDELILSTLRTQNKTAKKSGTFSEATGITLLRKR